MHFGRGECGLLLQPLRSSILAIPVVLRLADASCGAFAFGSACKTEVC
jgi:hypothetical protein